MTVELRMLKRGMEGGDVRSAMLLMKDKGYYPYAIPVSDKLFGAKMEAGLRKMQADHGLGVTVSWGPPVGAICWGDKDKVRAHSVSCVL